MLIQIGRALKFINISAGGEYLASGQYLASRYQNICIHLCFFAEAQPPEGLMCPRDHVMFFKFFLPFDTERGELQEKRGESENKHREDKYGDIGGEISLDSRGHWESELDTHFQFSIKTLLSKKGGFFLVEIADQI